MRMRLRFKSVLVFIFILIVACASVGVGYLFYNEVVDKSSVVVDGDLTINYINGDSFSLNGDATLAFSVTNNSDEQRYYYIQLSDVYASDVNYELTSSDNLDISNTLKSDIISNQVSINSNETINYTLSFKSNQSEQYSGTIKIGLKSNEENTFADVILSNNKVSDTALTNFGDPAVLDEGLLQAQDDLGVAYYFRGAVTNNNVSFGGYNWKIVKINGDGSVKLVLDGILEEISSYYEDSTAFIESDIIDVLESWYDQNLTGYSDYIAYYKYCNDSVLEPNSTSYAAYSRIVTNKIPTFVCLGYSDNGKIGLLTADEVVMAGGSMSENTSYYLYNSGIETPYYTMTSAKNESSTYYPFIVNTNGALSDSVSGDLLRGVRPVINIIKTAKVTGTGTTDDPYQIIMN